MDRFQGSEARCTLEFLESLGLISPCELGLVNAALADRSLATCLEYAETINLHVKLDDTDKLANAALEAAGRALDHARRGFVKYRKPGHLNAIFSHIPVAADNVRECEVI